MTRVDTIYVSIGNSDGKLDQMRWHHFVESVRAAVHATHTLHGEWFSLPDSPWQNACWALVGGRPIPDQILWQRLTEICEAYEQDSIAWVDAETQFVKPRA